MAKRVCTRPGCPTLVERGRCLTHTQEAEAKRGTAAQRGYTSKAHRAFRRMVLARDPVCVVCFGALSTVADHFPLDRRELVARGLNPNDPQHGRGLCASCHGKETARLQPGGWHADR